MSTSHKKQIFFGVSLFAFVFFLSSQLFNLGGVLAIYAKSAYKSAAVAGSVLSEDRKSNIKLAFVGDIMLDRGVKNSVYNNFSGDYSELFSKVRDQLRGYDVLFANLEGPVSGGGEDVGGIYSFRMEPRVIPVLKDAGFDILSLSNNHIFNWGETAFTDTLQLLSGEGIIYTGGGYIGSKAYKEKIINVDGVKVAYLAFSEFSAGGVISSSTNAGIAIISEKDVNSSVYRAKQNADLVVVSYHFGEEYQSQPNSYQRKYAELAIDSGADLVVGYHPHVLQPLEQYKNTYIIYSLGNFIFDQYFSKETMEGGLLEVEVNPIDKKIEVVNLKKVSINTLFQVESIE